MLVSVIIPSYNHHLYVAQAIESVLDQSWPHVDLIVIDDGSQDGSPEMIRGLWERRGGFRFVTRENQGLLKTLNEGLHLAQGEFFCELASDDYFPADSLELRVKYLQDHPECVAVFGSGVLVHKECLTSEEFIDEKRRRIFRSLDPIPYMLKGVLPVFSTGLIRTDVLRAIGGFDQETLRYYEDLDTPVRLALAGRLGFVDSAVICRRKHDTNVSDTTFHIRSEKVYCLEKLLNDPLLSNYKKILSRRLRREYLKLGRYLVRTGSGTQSEIELFMKSRRFFFNDPRLLWYYFKLALTKRV